ncbi:MAG TPA: hypothetical protein VFS43_47270 [Polyangiaceae bacterium]|nr:hypothetical protein [Polyangiaceae bacterium]
MFATLGAACAPGEVGPEGEGAVASTSQSELRVVVGPKAVAYDYAEVEGLTSGVAGDRRLVFVTQALDGRVVALDRFTGEQVAELPPPPGGFRLPFKLRVPEEGRLVVLDPGGFPSPVTPSVARVFDYRYQYRYGHFEASLERTVSFEGLPLVFAQDIETLPDGRYVVSESIVGGLWVVRPDGAVEPGILPEQPFVDVIPELGPCVFPGAVVDGIPYQLPAEVAPGVAALATRGGVLYFTSSCRGGIRKVPVATLGDPTRTPAQRAADIAPVSLRPAGVEAEVIEGLAFNPAKPGERFVYATDSLQLRIIRVNIDTGARQELVEDSVLFDFPSSVAFLPPVLGLTPLVAVSTQEHRLAAINVALEADLLRPPWKVTKVYIGGPGGP